ncbi:MAG: TerB family tellurite resistance protein [Paramuribaculum sp.]|nr:TerB family tellurite resistance protein [Paramuribaculum sp.]
MMIVDGKIANEEKAELYRVGREFFNFSEEEINDVIVNTDGSLFIKPNSIDERVQFLYHLALIANADRVIQPEERYLLKKYVIAFDFLEENADAIIDLLLEKAKANISPKEIIKSL